MMDSTIKIMESKYELGQSLSGSIQVPGQEIQLNVNLESNSQNVIGGNVQGVVTDVNGNPIKNAYIQLETSSYSPVMHTITDANGKYYLTNINTGEYYIFAESLGMKLKQSNSMSIKNYYNYTVNFVLEESVDSKLSIIVGDLRNINTKLAIGGAVITLYTENDDKGTETLIAITYSNKFGQFAFREIKEGEYVVSISALGYTAIEVPAIINKNGQIVFLNEMLTESKVLGNGTVSGIITDYHNKPIDGADVILYSVNTGSNLLTPIAFTETNKNGVYLFGGIPQGTYIVKSNQVQIANFSVNK